MDKKALLDDYKEFMGLEKEPMSASILSGIGAGQLGAEVKDKNKPLNLFGFINDPALEDESD